MPEKLNLAERVIYDELTPPAIDEQLRAKLDRAQEYLMRRNRQFDAAMHFLFTGEIPKGTRPVYGDTWDRDYNAVPYPEAKPRDLAFYEDTGIGYLYGAQFTDRFAWELAGWTLVRTGGEARKRRK